MSTENEQKSARSIKPGRQLAPVVMVPSKLHSDRFDVLVRLPSAGLFVFAEARPVNELQMESMQDAVLFEHDIRIDFRHVRAEDLEDKNPQHGKSVYLSAGEGKRQRRIIVPLTMEQISATLLKSGVGVLESTSADGRRIIQADIPVRPGLVPHLPLPAHKKG